MPRPCKHPKRETWDRIRDLALQGWSYARISKEIGYSRQRIASIAREMGFVCKPCLESTVDSNAISGVNRCGKVPSAKS